MKMLRSLRKSKGISMKKLGEILGVSESAISQYETGKREAAYETTLKAAEYFNCSIDYLLRGDEALMQKEKPTAEGDEFSEEEAAVIQLLRQVPEEQRDLVVNMIEAALKSQGLLD